MKICMFTRSLPIHSIGGLELHVDTLSSTLVELGCNVSIITTSHPSGIEFEEKNGRKIYFLPGTKPGKYSRSWWKNSVTKFVQLHKKENFDIIHSQSAGAYYLFKKKINKQFNIPSVVSLHGTTIDEIKTKFRLGLSHKTLGLVKLIYNYFFWDKVYLSRCDSVIATSDEQVKILERYYFLDKEKIRLVYNSINEKLFSPKTIFQRIIPGLEIKPEDKIILSVARLKKEKGVQNIISVLPSVLKEIPNVKLIIIGDGEYKNRLINLVNKNNLSEKVMFLGEVKYEFLSDYFNICTIFVNSTIRENGYDLTILQAMSCGKPVVCSDVGSVQSVIDDGIDGLLYPKDNLKILTNKIVNLLKDDILRKNIGEKARYKIISKFSLRKMAENTVEVYKEVLRRSKKL